MRCMCPVMLSVWVRLFLMHAAHVLVGAVLLPLSLVLVVAAAVPLRLGAPEFLCLHLVLVVVAQLPLVSVPRRTSVICVPPARCPRRFIPLVLPTPCVWMSPTAPLLTRLLNSNIRQ